VEAFAGSLIIANVDNPLEVISFCTNHYHPCWCSSRVPNCQTNSSAASVKMLCRTNRGTN